MAAIKGFSIVCENYHRKARALAPEGHHKTKPGSGSWASRAGARAKPLRSKPEGLATEMRWSKARQLAAGCPQGKADS